MSQVISVNKLVVIGLGLIGGSLAKAAREFGQCTEVIGVARDGETAKLALELSVVDRAVQSLDAVAGELTAGDMVVIAVPTLAVSSVLEQIFDLVASEVTITDVASVKGSVVADAKRIYGEMPAQFVPGHPIAGGEQSGIKAVNSALFSGHKVILTPVELTEQHHIERVCQLWRCVGATVEQMPVEEHDEVLAATSHLPHMLAYSLVDTLAAMRENREIFRYAAGGFRDFTRIASSDPVMWRDIALANRRALLNVLDQLTANIGDMRAAIDGGDGDQLMSQFTRAREARNHFINMSGKKS